MPRMLPSPFSYGPEDKEWMASELYAPPLVLVTRRLRGGGGPPIVVLSLGGGREDSAGGTSPSGSPDTGEAGRVMDW
jgi:hypothetical protein